jgi:hypothetical protein
MPRKTESKPNGVQVTQYGPTPIDECNFHKQSKGRVCGEPAATAVIVTDPQGHGVLLKLCQRHLCRLCILLIEELE